MNRTIRHLSLVTLAAAAVLVPASAALAADATGCSGAVVSMTADGSKLDAAAAPGSGATADTPLTLDPAGSVAWKGSTSTAITDGTWSVSALGVTLLSGDAANTEKKTSAAGTTDLSTIPVLKVLLTGSAKIPVSGSITGTGGSCTASGYVTGTGSVTGAPLFWAGSVLTLLGLLLAASVLTGTKAAVAAAAVTAGGAAS